MRTAHASRLGRRCPRVWSLGGNVLGMRLLGTRLRWPALLGTLLVTLLTAACSGAPSLSGLPTATTSGTAPATGASAATPTGHQRFTPVRSDTGRILETTLAGARSGVTMKVWVWLPPQYDQPAFAHTAFPALMLYPGGAGVGHNAWVGSSLGAREFVAGRAQTVTPFVFVMPAMQLSVDQDTECADLPGQPKVGTFLSVDVRRMVMDNFRVLPGRAGWGAAGTSSGAYCAARLVFDHPDQYAAVVSIGGYFTIETNLPGGSDPVVRAGDPAAVAAGQHPDVSVLLWSSASPGPDLKAARRFLAEIRPPTRAELRTLPGGNHLTVDFAKMIPGTFTFLSSHLSAPVPVAGP